MKIYCLINCGDGWDEELSEVLLQTALDLMENKRRTMRVKHTPRKMTGEVNTEYEFGFIGSAGGIIFTATVDWDSGSTKTSFIVRPPKNRDELAGSKWVRTSLFPIASPANN